VLQGAQGAYFPDVYSVLQSKVSGALNVISKIHGGISIHGWKFQRGIEMSFKPSGDFNAAFKHRLDKLPTHQEIIVASSGTGWPGRVLLAHSFKLESCNNLVVHWWDGPLVKVQRTSKDSNDAQSSSHVCMLPLVAARGRQSLKFVPGMCRLQKLVIFLQKSTRFLWFPHVVFQAI